jgi:MraZ protein
VLTTGLDACLVAYPMQEWLAFEERLSKLPQFDPSVALLRRVIVSGAVDCEIDKLGRVLVPATLREHAGLEREALWAGMGKHIELWSKDRFATMRREVLDDAQKRAEVLKRLGELGL